MDGKFAKRIRMALGLSQRELAEKLGRTGGYIAQMESGGAKVSELHEARLKELLRVAVKSDDPLFTLIRETLS